jgi:molybdopterin molybdotransferase
VDRRSEGWASTPVGGHGSHLIGSLAHANAFALIPEHVLEVPTGGTVEVMLLDEESARR